MTSVIVTTGNPTPTGRGAFGTLSLYKLEKNGNLQMIDGVLKAGVMPMFVTALQGKGIFVVDSHNDGQVNSFAVRDGKIHAINSCSSGGKGPCHISSHRSRSGLLVANYEEGTVAFIPVASDGYLLGPSSVCKHVTAATPGKGRQDAGHPHGIYSDPLTTADLIRVADLGSNEIVTYEMKTASDSLTRVASVKLHEGAGPRHIAFGRGSGNYRAYAVNELDNTVSVLTSSTSEAELVEATYVSTLPSGWTGPLPFDFYTAPSHAAEIRAVPTGAGGDWVLVSNRGHDSVALLHAPKGDAPPQLIRTVSSGGRLPWSFDVYPAGTDGAPKSLQLLISNQFSGKDDWQNQDGNVNSVSLSLDASATSNDATATSVAPSLVTRPRVLFAEFFDSNKLEQLKPRVSRVEVSDVIDNPFQLNQDSVAFTLQILNQSQHSIQSSL